MLEFRLLDDIGSAESFRRIVRELREQGRGPLHIYPQNSMAEEVARCAEALGCEARIGAPDPLPAHSAGLAACHFLTETDAPTLSQQLLKLVDLRDGTVVAPRTRHAYDARPLFLISIPKAGTHLLYSLAKAFGYHAGIICPEWPSPGHWYCVEYSNSHTRATDFFIDTVRRSPFGNRHHPFATSPALFIYRNPLDILVSEANYYHRDGNAIFGGYLANRSFEQRLLALIEDPWLFGSFRDRMAGFVPWLEFPNVVPVSFEELVGARGGGEDAVQRRLIWSLQLKLHVPGNPEKLAAQVFDPDSPTFNEGRIGSYREKLDATALEKFGQLPQDFMAVFGYAQHSYGSGDARIPSRAEEFIRRPLTTAEEAFWDTPILIDTNCHGRSIVRCRGRFYAPGNEDLASLSEAALSRLPSAAEIAPLRHRLAHMGSPFGWVRQKLARILRRFNMRRNAQRRGVKPP